MAVTSITLQAKQISCQRGGRQLFSAIDIFLQGGDLLCCVGDNGSGKSSLLKILVGLLEPNKGGVYWCGKRLSHCRYELNQQLFYLGHKNAITSTLTPFENILLDFRFNEIPRKQIEAVLKQFTLFSLKDRLCSQLSQGQKQRVVLAKLMLSPAKCIILDEPFSALDQKAFGLVQEVIKDKLDQGALVMLVTHQPLNNPRLVPQMIYLSGEES